MRITHVRLPIAVLVSFSAVALPAYAASGSGPQSGAAQTHAAAPHTASGSGHQTTHVSATTHSSHATTSHTATSHTATSHTTHHVGSTTSHNHAGSHHTTTSSQTTSHGSTATSGTHRTSHTTARTTSSRTGATTSVSPLAQKISSHPQLASEVGDLLPPNTTLNDAARGFKNQGQFIAALHVSENLGIPFADLKKDMTVKHMSLGQSIQALKPSVDSTTEAHRGEQEADEDVRSTTSSHTEVEREESEHRLSISQRISSNTSLNTKVQGLLPSGLTLQQATSGFTSERQFLLALHASKDLGIPFTQIKGEMTGTDHDSLLRAIQELKPTIDAAAAVKAAQTETATDLQTTSALAGGDH